MAVHSPGNKDVLERRFVTAGKKIIVEGEQGDCAFLIQSGKVKVYAGSEGKRVELATLEPGQIFGEMTLLFGEPRSATVEAIEDTKLIVINSHMFQTKVDKSDPTIRAILPMLTKRIIQTNNSLLKRQSDLETLVETVTSIYQNIHANLPAVQKKTLENSVLPKLDELMSAIRSFRERYVVPDAVVPDKE